MSSFDSFPLGQPAFVTHVLDRAAHLRSNDEKLFALESHRDARAYVIYRDSLVVRQEAGGARVLLGVDEAVKLGANPGTIFLGLRDGAPLFGMGIAAQAAEKLLGRDDVAITELELLRARFAPKAEEAGGKMTVTAIALKVVASALKVFPQFNASLDMGKEEIIYKQYINIGVAVDTDRGLLVPVIREVDKKNIVELAAELTQLSKKAKDKKLTPEEMSGGTFTITNLGGIGGTGFSPIVNHPEVAILGLSRSRMEPEWVNNKFEPRLILPLSLSYDHRLIDGADAARFLRWIAEAFEQPFLLSVQG